MRKVAGLMLTVALLVGAPASAHHHRQRSLPVDCHWAPAELAAPGTPIRFVIACNSTVPQPPPPPPLPR